MIKKKLSILLLLLLAVLFIGSFSTSYALTLTENDIRNFCENSYKAKVNVNIPSTVEQNIANADFSAWVNAISSNEGRWAIFYSYGSAYLLVYNGSAANLNTYTMYKASNRIYVNTSYLSRVIRSCFSFSDGSFNNSSDIYDVSDFLYTDSLITNNGRRDGTVVYSAGTYKPNSDIFSGRYTNDKFEFSPISSYFTTASIDGLSTPNNVYVYDGRFGILTLGYLEKFSHLSSIYKVIYCYSKSSGWYELNSSAVDNFTGYYVQDDVLTYTVDLSNLRGDMLLLFSFQPNSFDFNNQDFWLYIKSPYTYISNGIIFPNKTFSGDYYNNYNDDNNTDKITDNNTNDTENITDTLTDDSQVDNILGSNLSGDNLLNNIGYNPIQNPFSTIILNTMTNFTDALLGSGSQTLSFTIFNNTISISSDDFVLPNGELRNFISLICNGFLVYQIIKYGFQLYQWINTGRIQNLVNEANNHQYYLF